MDVEFRVDNLLMQFIVMDLIVVRMKSKIVATSS